MISIWFRIEFPFWRSIFDWRNPFGYIFAFVFELIGAAYLMLICACLMSQGFSSCWLFIAFADDLKSELSALNKYTRTKRKTKLQIYDQIHKFFQFHTKVKQLSWDHWHRVIFLVKVLIYKFISKIIFQIKIAQWPCQRL